MKTPVRITNHNQAIHFLSKEGEGSFGSGISLPLDYKPKIIDETDRIVLFCLNAGNWVKRYYVDDNYKLSHYWIKPVNNDNSIDDTRLKNGISILNSHNSHSGITGSFGIAGNHFCKDGRIYCYSRFHKNESVTPVWEQVKDGTIRFNSMGSFPVETAGVQDSDDVWWYEYRVHMPFEKSLCLIPADHDSFSMSQDMINKYHLGI
jgi:hypothetical protein